MLKNFFRLILNAESQNRTIKKKVLDNFHEKALALFTSSKNKLPEALNDKRNEINHIEKSNNKKKTEINLKQLLVDKQEKNQIENNNNKEALRGENNNKIKMERIKSFLLTPAITTTTSAKEPSEANLNDDLANSAINSNTMNDFVDDGTTINGDRSPPSPTSNTNNSSKPKFPNFLPFRSHNSNHQQNNNGNEKNSSTKQRPTKPKFLRTMNATVKAKHFEKSHSVPNSSFNFSKKKQASFMDDLEGESLFSRLDQELESLITHFKYIIQQTNESQSTPHIPTSVNYLETNEMTPTVYLNLAQHGKTLVKRCRGHTNKLLDSAHLFDYDNVNLAINGYRSLGKVFENSCRRLLGVASELNEKKSSFLFVIKFNFPVSVNTVLKDFQTWLRVIEKMEVFLKIALDMQEISLNSEENLKNTPLRELGGPTLFVDSNRMIESNIERDLFHSSVANLEDFFGRACGFQFCDSLQLPMAGCTIALASYNDGYESSNSNKKDSSPPSSSTTTPTANTTNTTAVNSLAAQINQFSPQISIGQAAKSLFSSTKYLMDPDLRAKKVAHVLKNADVDFCKAFWQLTETNIISRSSNLILPNVTINVLKRINFQPIRIAKAAATTNQPNISDEPDYVEVGPPTGCTVNDTVQIRILSSEIRDGMKDLDKLQTDFSGGDVVNNTTNSSQSSSSSSSSSSPKSPCLILHAHGGGFIAHSSKSHEVYLRPWAKELKVPIVSIDYSLAPEFPFPRASEECFYVYAWCLQNKNLIGWTGEKIICVGDSAGGILVTNIVQRAIDNQIRVPDALVPIYTPFLLTYSLSPSRLLSIMDPVLNIAILWRCLGAYCGVDSKSEIENLKRYYNLDIAPAASPTSSQSSSSLSPATPTKNNSFINRLTMKYFKESASANSVNSSANAEARVEISSTTNNQNNNKHSNSALDVKYIDDMSDQEKENQLLGGTKTAANGNRKMSAASASPKFSVDEELNEENKSEQSTPEMRKKNQNGTTTANGTAEDYEKTRTRLLDLNKLIGDSVFLIEKLRNHPAPLNHYMSPLLSKDEMLAKFPKTYLISASHCPLLDDSVEFLKRLKNQTVSADLKVMEGLHHGFLNFISVSKDSHNGYDEIIRLLKVELVPSSTTTTTTVN